MRIAACVHLAGEISLGESAAPEPVSMLLLGAGIVGLVGFRRFARQ